MNIYRINKICLTSIIVLFTYLLLSTECYANAPKDWQVLFQVPASPVMEEIEKFHNLLLIIIGTIIFVVLGLLIYVCVKFNVRANPTPATFSHNLLLEAVWTAIPIIILIIIALPSFRILRMENKIPIPDMTIKVVGYQWYWHYIYPDHNNIEFDSNLLDDKSLKPGDRRLLEVDNRLVVPVGAVVKFLITGGDVIHSFALPSLGIKTDAVPGRINETWAKFLHKGIFYGQCSELCGIHHGFMPIAVEVVSKQEFDNWLKEEKSRLAATNDNKSFTSLNLD